MIKIKLLKYINLNILLNNITISRIDISDKVAIVIVLLHNRSKLCC